MAPSSLRRTSIAAPAARPTATPLFRAAPSVTRASDALYACSTRASAAPFCAGVPKLLTSGGRDLVIVDAKNVLWRWRASDKKGNGTTTRPKIGGSAQWGDDLTAIGTFAKASTGFYNLYLVDPSERNIRSYAPLADGTGFSPGSVAWLAVERDVSKMTALFIDGDVFATDDGNLLRFSNGKSEGWDVAAPGDTLLRSAPRYSLITSTPDKRQGLIYAYDKANSRVVAIDKAKGSFVKQYRLAGGVAGWEDIRGMYVLAGAQADVPPILVWATKDAVFSAVLESIPDAPPPSASPSVSGSGGPGPSAAASRQP